MNGLSFFAEISSKGAPGNNIVQRAIGEKRQAIVLQGK